MINTNKVSWYLGSLYYGYVNGIHYVSVVGQHWFQVQIFYLRKLADYDK